MGQPDLHAHRGVRASNLQLLTPYEHAKTDLFAGRMFGRSNPRRDLYGNRAVATRGELRRYTWEQREADFPSRTAPPLSPFPLIDEPRANEPVVAFDQRTLAELVAALHEDEWQRALRATADVQGPWNTLVDRLNAQVDAYGMPAALRLPKI